MNDQLSLWDAILPSELLVLPAELARVDHAAGRSGVVRSVRVAFRCSARASLGPGGDLPADDVFEVPILAELRVVVPGGRRFDFLATVFEKNPYACGPNPYFQPEHAATLIVYADFALADSTCGPSPLCTVAAPAVRRRSTNAAVLEGGGGFR